MTISFCLYCKCLRSLRQSDYVMLYRFLSVKKRHPKTCNNYSSGMSIFYNALVFAKRTHVSAVRCFRSVFALCARQSRTAFAWSYVICFLFAYARDSSHGSSSSPSLGRTTASLTSGFVRCTRLRQENACLNGTFVVPTKFLCLSISKIHRKTELYVLQESACLLYTSSFCILRDLSGYF